MNKRAQMKLIWISIFIVVGALTFFVVAQSPNYIIEGDKVYVDTPDAYLEASPHTSNQPVITFTPKTFTGNVDIMFGFDSTNFRPVKAETNPHLANVTQSYTCNSLFNYSANHFTCYKENINNQTLVRTNVTIFEHDFSSGNLNEKTAYWNEEEIVWDDVSGIFSKTNYDYSGSDTWYYKTNIPVIAGQTYKLKVTLQPLSFDTSSEKWNFAVKPSSQTLAQAISSGNLYLLDPWTAGMNDGLTAYLDEDDTGNPVVDSVNGTNNGTARGTPTFSTTGKINDYLALDGGADDIFIPHSTSMNLGSGSYSLCAWVNVTNQAFRQEIFLKRQTGASNHPVELFVETDGTPNFNVWSGASSATITSANTFDDGEFHAWCIRRDTTLQEIVLFIDNVFQGRAGDTFGSITNTYNLTIGSRIVSGSENHLIGGTDEVAIWGTTAKDNSTFASYYNSGNGLARSSTAPTIPSLNAPLNNTNWSSLIPLNWTNSTDPDGDSIIYSLEVSSDSSFTTTNFSNYSIPETASPTGKTPSGITDGKYYWRVLASDGSLNSSWSEYRVFTYDSAKPYFLNVSFPLNNSNFSTKSLDINISYSDALTGVQSIKWSNDSGISNHSLALNLNLTGVTWLEGINNLTFWATDYVGNENETYVNFIADTLAPNQTIISPTNASSYSSTSVPYNVSLNDTLGFDTCVLWVLRGASYEVANTTQICPANNTGFVSGTLTLSGDASYVFFFYSNDTFGHESVVNKSFVVSTPAGVPASGSAGGSAKQDVPPEVEKEFIAGELCLPFKEKFFNAWEQSKQAPNFWERIKILYSKFWDFTLCGSASSVVPI